MTTTNANKRIARNTLFLYIRKILSLFISLYTSRILLQTIGVDDFGLYGLVGSIVLLFNSLRGLFASSIQRFLNVEKGSDIPRQNEIFSMGVSIHFGIAVVFLIVVEIAGLIMIPHLNLEPEKISVAYWLLQFSIASAVVSILTVPYDALMMAKERFDAIAGFSLLDSFLRLGVIYLLVISPFNRVVTYSALLLGVGILIRMLNATYCHRHFREISTYHYIKNRLLLKEMTQFAGWNFLGNLGFSLTNQALNFILNLFGGVVANAARTIAYQVNGSMRSFIVDLTVAFTPQSMMAYHDNQQRFYNLQYFSVKASCAIFFVFVFPMYLLTEPVLMLWLGESPEYAVSFIRGILYYSLVRNWHNPIDIAFKSANKMKLYQICEIIIMTLNLPLAWLTLHFGAPLYSIFIVMTLCEIVNMIAILIIGKRQIAFPIWSYFWNVILPSLAAVAIFAIGYALYENIGPQTPNFWQLLLCCVVLAIIAIIVDIFVVFNRTDRANLYAIILKNNRKS